MASLSAASSPAARRCYEVLACDAYEDMARRLSAAFPDRFTYHHSKWATFPDGSDNIELGGYSPVNQLRGKHVLFLAAFSDNSTTLSQFYALIVLLESFIESLTVVLPFYPTGTMERVVKEGQIATASTLARIFNTLPSCGKPTCLLIYDIHTLQNRFYLMGNCLPQLETTVPLLKTAMANGSAEPVDMVAFPDDGAAKRFKALFQGFETVICGKHREGDKRVITIQDGDPSKAKHLVIVDDLVQSGGTLYECAVVLRQRGAPMVSAFCAHGVFPKESWRRFARGGDRAIFDRFWVTNSIPKVTAEIPKDDVFEVLDLMPKIVGDLL